MADPAQPSPQGETRNPAGISGLSRSDLHYMRSFVQRLARDCQACSGPCRGAASASCSTSSATLTSGNGTPVRAAECGWSNGLLNQIMSQLHGRPGAAPSNFTRTLPAGNSDLVQQTTNDPYNLKFFE